MPAGSIIRKKGSDQVIVDLTVEVLCAALAGGNLGVDQGSFTENDGKPVGNGQFFIAFDPDKFSGGSFDKTIEALVSSITCQEGSRLPNARREANKVRLTQNGITIEKSLGSSLSKDNPHLIHPKF